MLAAIEFNKNKIHLLIQYFMFDTLCFYLHVSRIWIYYSNCSPSTEAAKVVATTAFFAIISPTYAHSEYYSKKWTSLACAYVKSIAFHSAATTLYIVVSMNSDWSNAAFEMRRSDIAKPTRWANSAFFCVFQSYL